MLFWIWTAAIIAALTLYFRQRYTRFSRYGVKSLMVIPPFGTILRIVLRMEHMVDDLQRIYRACPDDRFVGKYEFLNPMVIIRDLELVKKLTVKDFDSFIDHREFTDQDSEPLLARNLFFLKGDEWKDMRSTLSPAFTSSKIKGMLPFIDEVCQQMVQSIKMKIKGTGVGYADIECKDLSTRSANDIIASCAFGLKVDSHAEKNNKFYEMGIKATTFNFWQLLMVFLYNCCPDVMKKLRIKIFTQETRDFLRNLVMNTMDNREQHKIIRLDMIHLLMEAKKGRLSHEDKDTNDKDNAGFASVEESTVDKKKHTRVWSDDDLTAQAIIFLLAGFETISAAMSFALYEIALASEVQDRLAEEIRDHYHKCGGKLDFSSVQNLTYLDMVISEVLRKWPPLPALDRVCTKDYNLDKPNASSTQNYIVKEGETIVIPVWCFHYNPQYFPDPEKFDPERFSEENKHLIHPLCYIPFGIGPRNCIGSRFALYELKVMLYHIVLHMKMSPCEKTCIRAKLSTENFNLKLAGGHWVRFSIRT